MFYISMWKKIYSTLLVWTSPGWSHRNILWIASPTHFISIHLEKVDPILLTSIGCSVSAQPVNQGSGMISSIMAACTVYFKVSGVQTLDDCFRFPFLESLN